MSSRGDAERLQDILEAIMAIERHATGITNENDLLENEMAFQAILYNLTIIGEASDQLSEKVKVKSPNTDWRAIKSMRNLITHEYFRVQAQFVLGAITKNLPALKTEIEQIQRE
ncbi:MAG: HepT-like ribonuclease domain-containing protein [Cyanobacteria bacterium P01_F01_bin.153]